MRGGERQLREGERQMLSASKMASKHARRHSISSDAASTPSKHFTERVHLTLAPPAGPCAPVRAPGAAHPQASSGDSTWVSASSAESMSAGRATVLRSKRATAACAGAAALSCDAAACSPGASHWLIELIMRAMVMHTRPAIRTAADSRRAAGPERRPHCRRSASSTTGRPSVRTSMPLQRLYASRTGSRWRQPLNTAMLSSVADVPAASQQLSSLQGRKAVHAGSGGLHKGSIALSRTQSEL